MCCCLITEVSDAAFGEDSLKTHLNDFWKLISHRASKRVQSCLLRIEKMTEPLSQLHPPGSLLSDACTGGHTAALCEYQH